MDNIVRPGTLADEAKILDLCWLAYKEMPPRSLSVPKVEAMVRNTLTGQGVAGVVDVDGDIRGLIGLCISSAWYSDDLEMYDWLAFVRPDCRHLRYFSRLLVFAKEQADLRNMPLWLGFIGDERIEAKARAYRRHVPRFGELFRYTPTQAA